MDALAMRSCPECGEQYQPGRRCPRCQYDAPTPAEIRLACLAIQRTWTSTEKRQRTIGAYRPVHADTPTVTRVSDHMRRRETEGSD